MPTAAVRLLDLVNRAGPDLRQLRDHEIAERRADPVPDLGALTPLVRAACRRIVGRPHPGVEVHDTTVAGATGTLPLRVSMPRERPRDAPLVVHLHGGGWVLGRPADRDWLCTHVAAGLGAVVASVDYRKAPEHPAPAAVEDALVATRALLGESRRRFGATGPVAVAGDSAGGNLAALVGLALRDDPRVVAQWLTYPAIDLTQSFPSHRRLHDAPLLRRSRVDQFLELYLDGADAADPRVSPWHAADRDGLEGVAATLVQLAACDPLVDEGAAWADRLRAAGVDTRTTTYADVPHGFASMPGLVPAAHDALAEGLAFLAPRLTPAAPPPPVGSPMRTACDLQVVEADVVGARSVGPGDGRG